MSTDKRLLDYYERELIYLRTAGQAFARKHEKVAQRLELSLDQNPDPHVERLIEAFAFLSARLHETMDDRLSDLARNMLERLYPHVLRPLPSMSVVQFNPGKLNLDSGFKIERGTRLFTRDVNGDTLRFQTCQDVELWPLQVSELQMLTENLDSISGGRLARSALKITLSYPEKFALNKASLGGLRFYLRSNTDAAAQLCDLMLGDMLAVRWAPYPGAPELMDIPDTKPHFLGLEEFSALLPERADTHPSYRLLLEYFSFPHKFQFFDLDCTLLDQHILANETYPAEATIDGMRSCELYLFFSDRPSRELPLQAEDLQLGCTPVINLFTRDSEPLRITGTQTQYRLVADIHRERSTEIYTVDSMATLEPNIAPVPVPEFYASGRDTAPSVRGKYWYAQRSDSVKDGMPGTDIQISFVDTEFDPVLLPQRTLVAKLTCTNRRLAEQLAMGDALALEDGEASIVANLIHKPSPQTQPSLAGSTRWKLVSQLSLNHLALTEDDTALQRIQELLSLNNLAETPNAESQIKGIRMLQCERVTRHIANDPWQGYRQGYLIRIQLDQALFRGSSRLLFATVLHRFLGLFAGINTFVELVVDRGEGRPEFRIKPLLTHSISL